MSAAAGMVSILSLRRSTDGRRRWRSARTPRPEPLAPDRSEGTFSLCTFLYVDALARAGRLAQDRYTSEKMQTYANHVGLFAEEVGPSAEQLGDFPRAFTHLSLIMAANTLDKALDAEDGR